MRWRVDFLRVMMSILLPMLIILFFSYAHMRRTSITMIRSKLLIYIRQKSIPPHSLTTWSVHVDLQVIQPQYAKDWVNHMQFECVSNHWEFNRFAVIEPFTSLDQWATVSGFTQYLLCRVLEHEEQFEWFCLLNYKVKSGLFEMHRQFAPNHFDTHFYVSTHARTIARARADTLSHKKMGTFIKRMLIMTLQKFHSPPHNLTIWTVQVEIHVLQSWYIKDQVPNTFWVCIRSLKV